MFDATDPKILQDLRKKIKNHNFKSGEIILEFDFISENETQVRQDFFIKFNIKTRKIDFAVKDFSLVEISRDKAMESVKYGLSTKANYTLVDKEFSDKDQNYIWSCFQSLFTKPKFFTIEGYQLYQGQLDLDDMWETGGAILIDSQFIGILWINDLYSWTTSRKK